MSVDQSVSLDLEQELINHLVVPQDAEFAVRDGLSPELLYVPINKSVYNFVRHYVSETGQTPTQAVLLTEFPTLELTEPESSIEWLIEKLRDRYQRNKVQDLSLKLAEISHEPSKAMKYLSEEVLEIQKKSLSQRYIWGAGDSSIFLSQLQDQIMAGHYRGLPTGFPQVDEFTGGLKPGYLAFLAARPKRMKTFFMLKSFIEQKRAGFKPVLFTLENTEQEIMMRISCLLSGYPWDLAQRGIISDSGWKLLENTWKEFDSLGDHWIARPPMDERSTQALMLQADKLGADSVIISQFKYVLPNNDYYLHRPDHEKWGSIVVDLKQAATKQGSERPIYVEAQLNREGERIEDFTDLGLGQMGLTDMIGQASDIVFALYQNKEMRENNQVQFGIVEARNSDKRNWYVTSEYKQTTYLEML